MESEIKNLKCKIKHLEVNIKYKEGDIKQHLASREPVRKPASLCKEVEGGRLARTGASST